MEDELHKVYRISASIGLFSGTSWFSPSDGSNESLQTLAHHALR